MQTVADSEYGAFFVNADGDFVFKDRATAVSSIGDTPTVFEDAGAGIRYANAKWLLNDDLIFNSATVTRTGGTAQTATNAASIAKYFIHSFNQQDSINAERFRSFRLCKGLCAQAELKQPLRCDAIELDLYTPNYDTGIVAALSLEFFDPITVSTTQPGGSLLEDTLQIFGVANTITPNSFKVVFTTLEPVIDGFIIGNVDYGVIDQSVLSY